ncbi:MAG: TetR/AcrR family transcriptional regulator [Clostridiales bacterium]|nr:TetR/AcrR family transcriptional regulator [Clostridiales bacterium]
MEEQFLRLPEEKRVKIINAAMEIFAKNDYPHASTDLIAAKAGISKGSLFYYFSNKKSLYLYLINYTEELTKGLILDDAFWKITDFFDLLTYTSAKKAEVLKRNPYFMDFSIRAFYSRGETVSEETNHYVQSSISQIFPRYFKNIRFDKFKENVDPREIMDMLIWISDGYIHQMKCQGKALDMDDLMEHFERWSQILKTTAYKEEFL